MLLTIYHAFIGSHIRRDLKTMVMEGREDEDLFAFRINLARKHFYRLLLYAGLSVLTTFLLMLSVQYGLIPAT